jgi:hypothetical protein
MTKKKIQLTPIEFPMFDTYIHYFVTDDMAIATAFMKERGYDYVAHGYGCTLVSKQRDPIVWLKNKRPDIVAHEMIHAVFNIFKELGQHEITKDNDEIFAYMVDYAVKEVLK